MPEQDLTTEDRTERPARRRMPDLFTLFAGIATLCVSVYLLTDGQTWLPAIDARWALAGGALLVGVLMLLASLRGNDRR